MGRKLPGSIVSRLLLSPAVIILLAGCGNFLGFGASESPDTGLESFRLYLSDEELGTLADSLTFDIYAGCRFVPAVVPNGPVDQGQGELRIRGFTSRMGPKKSYTLRWEEQGERRKIALDSGGRPWISYALAMYAYHLAGLPYLEMSPIALYMNDEYIGYYNTLPLYDESVDDFFNEDGHLFKIRAFDLGNEIPAESYSEKTYPDDDDYSLLNRYLVNAAHMPGDEWTAWVEEYVHLEDLARYMAVRDFLGMEDTYNTNFYVYAGEKYRILPWDNDHIYKYDPVGGDNILTTRMLESAAFADIYRDTFNALFLDEGDENILGNMALFADNLYVILTRAAEAEPWSYLTAEAFAEEKTYIDDFLSTRPNDILNDPGWNDFFKNGGSVPQESE